MPNIFKNIADLKAYGFEGFIPIGQLWDDQSAIPQEQGVYLVLNTRQNNINFINPGVGGFFQGRNPNIPIDVLRENFIDDTIVLYIGKAGGTNNRATLQSRIRQYINFGQGKNAGHYGGRYIWQIREHKELLICWKILKDDEPREIEGQLITKFENHYNRLPFANLRH